MNMIAVSSAHQRSAGWQSLGRVEEWSTAKCVRPARVGGLVLWEHHRLAAVGGRGVCVAQAASALAGSPCGRAVQC